jgi:hypothetical protein
MVKISSKLRSKRLRLGEARKEAEEGATEVRDPRDFKKRGAQELKNLVKMFNTAQSRTLGIVVSGEPEEEEEEENAMLEIFLKWEKSQALLEGCFF